MIHNFALYGSTFAIVFLFAGILYMLESIGKCQKKNTQQKKKPEGS